MIKKLLMGLAMLLAFFVVAYGVGDGNLDGGGGSMEDGSGGSFWNIGNDGVRVSVIRHVDKCVVGDVVDFTNKSPASTIGNFGSVSKLTYSKGKTLAPQFGEYLYKTLEQPIPRIISTSAGGSNIAAIKKYFCSEYVLKRIAEETGMDYETLIGGDYKVMIEPVAYFTYQGVNFAMTATEAALYDEQLGGKLRAALGNLTHKNLPLAIFLETADLGYPAWSGSKTDYVTNQKIKSALGVGIIRFKDGAPEGGGSGGGAGPEDDPWLPSESTYDYKYRTDTEVVSSIWVGGGQSDPKSPTTVQFSIMGSTYTASNVYYPEDDSQLVWVKWRTPATPQDVNISVTVVGPGSAEKATIRCAIVDLQDNPPPNPVADDRNDMFSYSKLPPDRVRTEARWGVWVPWWKENWVWHPDWQWESDWDSESRGCYSYCKEDCAGGHTESVDNGEWVDNGKWIDDGWYEFDYDNYTASLEAQMQMIQDKKNPTATGREMKSGYGVNQTVSATVRTNQRTAITEPQTAVSYFPEFGYMDYWRLLERTSTGLSSQFQFRTNKYSTYGRRTHFSPIWMPDGPYQLFTRQFDCWTPAGMLSIDLTDKLSIQGSLWDDWMVTARKTE